MQNQAGAIAELARDLEGTTQIMERLRLLLADRNQTLDGEMAAIQVCVVACSVSWRVYYECARACCACSLLFDFLRLFFFLGVDCVIFAAIVEFPSRETGYTESTLLFLSRRRKVEP